MLNINYIRYLLPLTISPFGQGTIRTRKRKDKFYYCNFHTSGKMGKFLHWSPSAEITQRFSTINDIYNFFSSKCGPSAMSTSPRSSSSSRYHEVNKKEVSRIYNTPSS